MSTEAVGRSLALGRGSSSHLRAPNGYGVFKDCPENSWLTARCGQRPRVSVVSQEPHRTWQQRGQWEGGRQVHRDPWTVGEKLELDSPALAPRPHTFQPRRDPADSYQAKLNFLGQTQWQRNWYCPCPPPGENSSERSFEVLCACVQK